MSDAWRRLVDHLPPRSPAAARDANADPRALRAVLDALPMANFGVALKRLLDSLQRLNRHSFEGPQRLDGLEVLRESALQLLASADRQIGGTSFPLPRQKAELGELALQFRGEFATGYRIALAELCKPNGAVPFMRGRQVAMGVSCSPCASRKIRRCSADTARRSRSVDTRFRGPVDPLVVRSKALPRYGLSKSDSATGISRPCRTTGSVPLYSSNVK